MAENENNPRNPESPLFKRLTKLFSGPIVNYRSQTPRASRRRHLDKFRFSSTSGQQFKKTQYNPFESLSSAYMSNQNRGDRYADFDQMEYTPEIASALDIYADEMTTSTSLQPLMTIDCPNGEIKTILGSLYNNILNIEFNLFGWCRTMCKYGDFFLYLDIDENEGIKNAIGLPPHELERLEGEDKTNPNYVQFQWNSGGLTFENWQVAHFRILGNDKYAPYGTSALEPARRIWRQLTLLEDAMMAYRIVRSPERRVFYIDVGNIAPNDIEQYMQRIMTQMKRSQIVDPDTGRVDLRYNPMSVDEDYFIPMRAGQSSRVESLPGGTYTGDIDDVKYLRDKLFSALKVPMSYLSRGEGADEDKATLAQKDIRFARTIQRLQRAIISEIEKVGVIHLYTLGYRGDDLVSFKLQLNNPSRIAELQELEHWRTRFDIAGAATEGYFSKRWVAKKIFSLSDEEHLQNLREMFYDKKHEAALEAAAEEDAAPGGEGGEGEEGGDEFGGGMDLGGGEEELGGEEEEGEEGPLLAAPARREDGSYLTPGAKGKYYKPVNSDKRNMGARKRSYHGVYAGEVASSAMRNIYKGNDELSSLVNAAGLSEDKDSNYSIEEKKVFKVNYDIGMLIEELESKNNETETQ
jgi:hypothetical protein